MPVRMVFIALAAVIALPVDGWATLTIDPPVQITHQLTVQMIRTAKDGGATQATLFGNTSETANIKSRIDQIWAQVGIDINFLPTVNLWDSAFAYQGNAGAGTRPSSDLDSMISLASGAGLLNTQPEVVNIFFVEVVPSFTPLAENYAAGYAKIGFDGIALTIGNQLPGFQNGRDVAAYVVAHEIGHNLGLQHTADGISNLMSPGGTSQKFTEDQLSAVFQTTFRNDSVAFIPTGGTGFPQPLSYPMGDYNQNGVVDAADYTVWRNAMETPGASLPSDPSPESVTQSDFTYWRAHFGDTLPAGGGAAGDFLAPPAIPTGPAAIPEPGTLALASLATLFLLNRRERRDR